MGVQRTVEFLGGHPEVDALLFTQDGELYLTKGAADSFIRKQRFRSMTMIGRPATVPRGCLRMCTGWKRWHPSSATARAAESIHSKESTSLRRTHRADTPSITSAIRAIMFKIWGLMCIKTTVPDLMDRGLALPAAVIHGCCKMSRSRPVPATVTEAIRALAGRPRVRPSTPAGTA